MKCTCGFDNALGARFCGKCGSALAEGPSSSAADAVPSTTTPAQPVSVKAIARPLPVARLIVILLVVVAAAAGYWWMNRPPGPFKPDNSGLYPINVNGKFGFMDRSGKTVIAPQFDETGEFSEGLAAVRIGTKWGYIDTKGVVVITPQFDHVWSFRSGRAGVTLASEQNGFIDKDGKYISTPDYHSVGGYFSEGLALVNLTSGLGGAAFVDRSGKVAIPARGQSDAFWSGAEFHGGLAPAASGAKWGYINAIGKWEIEPQFENAMNFADGLAPVVVGGRTAYIDRKGKFVVNPQYDSGGEFSEDYASVGNGGQVGFIDTKGRVVVEAKFLGAGHFSDRLAPVKTREGWGFIDPTGKLMISPQFDSAESFQNGLARVTVVGKEAYVTKTGSFVVDPFPGRAGIPTHPVQELWTGKLPDGLVTYLQRFVLIREGNKIRGHSYYNLSLANHAIELKGNTAQDGSFNIADQSGTSWKGRFVSSVLIEGVQVNPPGASRKESPMRLRLVRDATAEEVDPLSPTNSDWNIFLASFRNAVQRRDFGALSLMMARSFSDDFLTRAQELARVNWDQVGTALARGVETSSTTPWGSARREILDETPPCPGCVYRVMLIFSQDGDSQWRWAGIGAPGD